MSEVSQVRRHRKTLRYVTVMLAAVTGFIWLALLVIKLVFGDVDFPVLLDDIMSNILGILPPIIIFNFAYEYFTRDYVTDDISRQIIGTLTGQPEMIGSFRKGVRREFIKSTVVSLVGEHRGDMAYGALEPFISEQPYDVKESFQYIIDIKRFHGAKDIGTDIFSPDVYYMARENLRYRKIFSGGEQLIEHMNLGFFADSVTLEAELIEKNYLFRESFNIEDVCMARLLSLSEEERLDFIRECLQLTLFLNKQPTDITGVSFGEFGISVELSPKSPIVARELEIDLGVRIPLLRSRSEFLVSLTEPTLSPEITLTYDAGVSNVTAYPFLSDDAAMVMRAGAMPGRYFTNPQGWVYPVKGILFIVEDIEGN